MWEECFQFDSTKPRRFSTPCPLVSSYSNNGSRGATWLYVKPGSHMPAVCLRLYHYASTCRRNTGKVELKSTFPAYRRRNCGTGGNRRTNVHIIYVLKLPPASSPVRRRHICEPGLLERCEFFLPDKRAWSTINLPWNLWTFLSLPQMTSTALLDIRPNTRKNLPEYHTIF